MAAPAQEPRAWLRRFEARSPRLLEDLEALVCHESPSSDAERVSALAAWIVERLRAAGVRAEAVPCPPRGDAVLAAVGDGPEGTLLLGHHDTVWPLGTLAERPFRLDGPRASGPGVFDMKAGIAVAVAALEALSGEPGARASLLLTPDEEVGTSASRELLLEVARRHARVLVLEPSLDGAAKVARKGTGSFEARLTGVPAHAGLEPEKGASALVEMARLALFAGTLADPARGTSVTATLARAGTAANVVPDAAWLAIDARVWSVEEARRVERGLREYRVADPRVALALSGSFDRPPLEETEASRALYARARAAARELGFELGAARVGGASDGNLTAAAGVTTLDGLGPRGDGAHARHEHVLVDDLAPRAALVAWLAAGGAEGGGAGP
jgi:glutamate carboxypeptidase